ncbi:hypothetical protein [Micromonospora eburnea]|uniref:hypothetical protein n=1 Tax=Micromonospora eburnea TaxID=227316 RepID=UPI000B850F9E|nr:hypothetical protein [Micromonospora eburnea]
MHANSTSDARGAQAPRAEKTKGDGPLVIEYADSRDGPCHVDGHSRGCTGDCDGGLAVGALTPVG